MEVKQNTTTILTRWYPENSYIKETASGTTREYTFIGGDAYTAPVVAITQSGTTTYYNLLRDHLGSITHVVNASTNTLVYQYSYDAWGRMRNVSTWNNYSPGSEPALFIAGRGFTGHEHLPWFNLINMNGRMYDPIAGQFLSPDNNIQDPYNSQNLNRYTYCLNNPLKYIDPSGNNYAINMMLIQIAQIIINSINNSNQSDSSEPEDPWIKYLNSLPWMPVDGKGGGGPPWVNNTSNNGFGETNNLSSTFLPPFRINYNWSGMPYRIEMHRIAETSNTTLSEFIATGPIPLQPVKGYILEPEGPSTIIRNQNKRIPSGVHWLTPYSGTKNPNVYRISSPLVPPDRYILMHTWTKRKYTTGCLLVGSSFGSVDGDYILGGDIEKMNELRLLLRKNSAIIIIYGIDY